MPKDRSPQPHQMARLGLGSSPALRRPEQVNLRRGGPVGGRLHFCLSPGQPGHDDQAPQATPARGIPGQAGFFPACADFYPAGRPRLGGTEEGLAAGVWRAGQGCCFIAQNGPMSTPMRRAGTATKGGRGSSRVLTNERCGAGTGARALFLRLRWRGGNLGGASAVLGRTPGNASWRSSGSLGTRACQRRRGAAEIDSGRCRRSEGPAACTPSPAMHPAASPSLAGAQGGHHRGPAAAAREIGAYPRLQKPDQAWPSPRPPCPTGAPRPQVALSTQGTMTGH